MPLHNKLNALHRIWRRLIGIVYYRHIFASFGRGSVLYKPLFISNPQWIHIGNNVTIRQGARLEAITLDGGTPELSIGNNVSIEQDVHIVSAGKVLIGENVTITGRCSVVGARHPFSDVQSKIKIGARLAGADSITEIGEGSFLGIGSVILINARLGRHVIVGANAVVRDSVPDYTVVAGESAVPVMSFDPNQNRWVKLPNPDTR